MTAAIDQIYVLLIKDPQLSILFEEATNAISSDRFQSNVARLLRKYGSDLRVRAVTDLERGVCQILIRGTRYIAFRITSYYFSDFKQMAGIHLDALAAYVLGRFLEQDEPFQPFLDASTWANIHQMRPFLVQSTAMERLRDSLERSIHSSKDLEHSTPVKETEDELSTKQSEPIQNQDGS